jgi:hypothetical protein
MGIDVWGSLLAGMVPAVLLLFVLAALPSIVLLGFIGLAVLKQARTALLPAVRPVRIVSTPARQ